MQSQACLSFAGANGHDTMHPSIHRLGITFVLEPLGISLFHSSFRSFPLLQCWLFCDRMMFIGCKDKYLSCNLQESLAISIMDVSFFCFFSHYLCGFKKYFYLCSRLLIRIKGQAPDLFCQKRIIAKSINITCLKPFVHRGLRHVKCLSNY